MRRVLRRSPFLAGAALCGCYAVAGFDGYDTSRGTSDAGSAEAAAPEVTLDPLAPVVLTRGASIAVGVSLDRHGAHGEIAVRVQGLPEGLSASDATVPPGVSAGSLALSVSPTAAPGTYSLSALAVLEGVEAARQPLLVTVLPSRPDPSFADGGTYRGAAEDTLEDLVVDDAGRALAGVRQQSGGSDRFVIYRDDGSGRFDRLFDVVAGGTKHRLATFPGGDILVASTLSAERHTATDGALVWSAPLFRSVDPTFEVRVAVTPDGKVAALLTKTGLDIAIDVHRVLPDGGADLTFGEGGLDTLEAPLGTWLAATALAPDGLAMCGVRQRETQGQTENLLALALQSDGARDPTWGDGGLDVVGNDTASFTTCAGLEPSGAVLVAATTTLHVSVNDENENPELVLVGVDHGRLAPSFGVGGLARHGELGRARAVALAVTSARMYTAYTAELGPAKVSARVLGTLPGGQADPSFGNADTPGVLVLPTEGTTASTAAVTVRARADGRILLGAMIVDPPGWLITRFLP